jgi:hypothetical protein
MKSLMFRRKTDRFDVLCFVPFVVPNPFVILLCRGEESVFNEVLKSCVEFEHHSREEFKMYVNDQILKEFGDDAEDIEIQTIYLDGKPMLIVSRNEDIQHFFRSLASAPPSDDTFFIPGPDTVQ